MEEVFYGISSSKPLNPKLSCDLQSCGCRSFNFIWISHKLELIYFETPKCGCTSIKTALDIGLAITPLHFATAYLIHKQNYGRQQDGASATLTSVHRGLGIYATPDALISASLLAASNLSEGKCWSDSVGEFEFKHFFGGAAQAIDLFPSYRRFIVVRDPFDRALSAWNMFYNSAPFRLDQRLFQCRNSSEERKSFRYFIENIWSCPNHHFDRITNFVEFEALARGTDVVPFENLTSYWRKLERTYGLPPLEHFNAAKNYLETDVSKSEILENERFTSYYSEDYELMKG